MNTLPVLLLLASRLWSSRALSSDDRAKCEALKYNLNIMELARKTFFGRLRVELQCVGSVSEIDFVAAEHFQLKNCDAVSPKHNCIFSREKNKFVLRFDKQITTNSITLTIDYASSYNDYDKGLYMDDTGIHKIYLSKGKALLFPYTEGKNAIVHIEEEVEFNTILLNFKKNTYNMEEELALVIGPIEYGDAKGNIEIYKLVGEEYTDDVLQMSDFVYEALKLVFGNLPYLITQVGLPISSATEFQAKGLVIYSDRDFYVAKRQDVNGDMLSIVNAISHHLLHQWFGIKKASEKVWIDEGLKTFLTYLIIDESLWTDNSIHEALGLLVVDHTQARAFEADGFTISRALDENPVAGTHDYSHQDPILYSKGASVMRSFLDICGLSKFRSVLSNYLETDDSFDLVDSLSGCINDQEAKDFARKFRADPGYAVVHVTDKEARTGTTFELKQERFLWQGEQKTNESWCLPIAYATDADKDWSPARIKWFCRESFHLDFKGDLKWIILNNQQLGFYRVNYPARIWRAIKAQLEDDHLSVHEINRAQIIDDIFSFARSTHDFAFEVPDYVVALNMTGYLKKERNYFPLRAAFNSLLFVDSALYGETFHENFRAYIRDTVEELYLTFNIKSPIAGTFDIFTIKMISHWACRLEIEKCIKDANASIQQSLGSPERLLQGEKGEEEPKLLEVSYCSMMRINGNAHLKWEEFFEIYKGEHNANYKILLLGILACSRAENHLTALLSEILQPVSRRFSVDIVDAILHADPDNANMVVEFLKSKKMEIVGTLGPQYLGRILMRLSRGVNAEGARKLLEAFKNFPEDEATRLAKEQLKAVISWRAKKMPAIEKFLRTKNSGENRMPTTFLLSAIVSIAGIFTHNHRIAF